NGLVEGAGQLLGGALLVLVFEEDEDGKADRELQRARRLLEREGARDDGQGPARAWFEHRYSVSYRQAPVFAAGAWVDTMAVAARRPVRRGEARARPARVRDGAFQPPLPRRLLHLLLLRGERGAGARRRLEPRVRSVLRSRVARGARSGRGRRRHAISSPRRG